MIGEKSCGALYPNRSLTDVCQYKKSLPLLHVLRALVLSALSTARYCSQKAYTVRQNPLLGNKEQNKMCKTIERSSQRCLVRRLASHCIQHEDEHLNFCCTDNHLYI